MNEQKELHNQLHRECNLDTIQEYVKNVINIRGFGAQPIEQEVLLLIEEVGELAKAIRKEKTNMCIDENKIKNYDTVESEIADVFIVLNSICNTLNINLYDSFYEKEKLNVDRTWKNEKND